MKWEHLQGRTDCLAIGGALVALYHINDHEVALVDSGEREEPALLEELERRELRVRAIFCTHLHPDHVANTPALKARHGAEVFAGAEELRVVASHRLYCEEYGLEVGLPAAEKKRLREYGYPFTAITHDTGHVNVEGAVFEIVHTPGHSRDHLAVVTPDGVCCVGDALVSAHILRNSKMPYMLDVNQSILSMERLRETRYPLYMTAHKEVTPREKLDALVDANIERELEIYQLLRGQLNEPVGEEELAVRLLQSAGVVNPASIPAGVLLQTAKARIAGLVQAGEFRMDNGVVTKV